MNSTSESGSRYLSLALSARSAMASLRPIVAGEVVRPELGPTLLRFLIDVQGSTEPNYVKHLEASGSAPSYEAASTCADITRTFGADELRSAFRIVIEGKVEDDIETSAWRLIEFFDAVESKALDRYATSVQSRMV